MQDSLTYHSASSPDSLPQAGLFVVFEGGDGSGKTTQVRLLAKALAEAGHRVVTTREPGGTDIGEKLRSLVLDHGNGEIDARTEALIFAASRAAHAHQLIRPSLAEGAVVLCDRYIDSSAAYQGAGRGLGVDPVTQLSLWATENLVPDLTILLDVPLNAGRDRAEARGAADRMESESDEFYTAIHATFGRLAADHPERYAVIDGTGSIEKVHEQVLTAVKMALDARSENLISEENR